MSEDKVDLTLFGVLKIHEGLKEVAKTPSSELPRVWDTPEARYRLEADRLIISPVGTTESILVIFHMGDLSAEGS